MITSGSYLGHASRCLRPRAHASVVMTAAALMMTTPVQAAGSIDVLLKNVAKIGHIVPPKAEVAAKCDDDIVCAARMIADTIGPGASVVKIDTLNAVQKWSAADSVAESAMTRQQTLYLRPDPLRATAFVTAWQSRPADVTALTIDLRHLTDETNLEGMRQVAGLLTGPVSRAFRLDSMRGRALDWSLSPPRTDIRPAQLTVLIGAETPRLGVVLAELLRIHAGGQILGEPSRRDDIVRQTVSVSRGWQLLVPRGTLQVPSLVPGQPVLPDGPIPPDLVPPETVR